MTSYRSTVRGLTAQALEIVLFVVLIIACWQMWIELGHVPPIVAPTPLSVAAGALTNWRSLATAAGQTLAVSVFGLAAGTLLGFTVAILSWASRFVGGMLLPAMLIAQSVPVVAMVPVIARLIGYDVRSVIAITVLISFFPTYAMVRAGFDRPPPGSNDLFSVFGAGRMQRLARLAIPAAMPNLLTAVRLSAANCILATLVAEFLMGTQGLGYLIAFSAPRMDLQTGWSTATVALVISIAMFLAASAFEGQWRERWM